MGVAIQLQVAWFSLIFIHNQKLMLWICIRHDHFEVYSFDACNYYHVKLHVIGKKKQRRRIEVAGTFYSHILGKCRIISTGIQKQ